MAAIGPTARVVRELNRVGRSTTHDEIAGYRQSWEDADQRFGAVQGYRGPVSRLPAPPLPAVRLRPRRLPQRNEHT